MNVNLLKRKRVPHLKIGLTLFSFCFFTLQAFAQLAVTGQVTDAGTGESLIGVNIMVKGTAQGTITDLDGNYSINLSEGTETLVFSFVGYANQEIAVNQQSTIDVTLAEGLALSEAVVTALGIKRSEKSLGYAVQKLNGDEFTEAKEPNFVNALSGKVAGVNITNGGSGVGDLEARPSDLLRSPRRPQKLEQSLRNFLRGSRLHIYIAGTRQRNHWGQHCRHYQYERRRCHSPGRRPDDYHSSIGPAVTNR